MSEPLATGLSSIWVNPEAAKGDRVSLVRLGPDALTLAKVAVADLEEAAASAGEGAALAGQLIPLEAVVAAKGDRDSAKLGLRFQSGPSKEEVVEIEFADRTTRDEFADALVEYLGPGWARFERPMGRWGLGFWTLGPTVLAGLVTGFLWLEASAIAAGRPPMNWGRGRLRLAAHLAHWLEGQLGPTGILIAGGVVVLVGLAIFAMVMFEPPKNLVVEPVESA